MSLSLDQPSKVIHHLEGENTPHEQVRTKQFPVSVILDGQEISHYIWLMQCRWRQRLGPPAWWELVRVEFTTFHGLQQHRGGGDGISSGVAVGSSGWDTLLTSATSLAASSGDTTWPLKDHGGQAPVASNVGKKPMGSSTPFRIRRSKRRV